MKRVSAKFVPKLLTAEQKQLRVEVSQDMLDSTNSDPDFLNTIITGDESWVYAVVTVEAFLITKTKEGPPSAQQCQSDADCFL